MFVRLKKSRWSGCLILPGILLAAFLFVYLAATAFPGIGAQGADFLRKIIGDQATAQLEMFVFKAQDTVNQVKYNLGISKPAAPWQTTPQAVSNLSATPTPTQTPIPASATPSPTVIFTSTTTPTPEFTPTPLPPTATATPTPWAPAPATALGSQEGEAIWAPYIQDAAGRTVAFRTFIQPDPQRPWVMAAVVAFDLKHTRLNFVLGVDEPKSSIVPKRPGSIPAEYLKNNLVIATFNGGFKSEHGGYGAMSNGVTAILPINGLATVVMDKDGQVEIGEWGKDFKSQENMQSWRQNCRLVVQDGHMNPQVNEDSAYLWGANLDGATVTWRSGIGISPDGSTLYYFAGPSLKANILAQAMLAAGVKNGMQLDINNYWVHFTAVRNAGGKPTADPLFPEQMIADVNRYLVPHQRDFFFVSLAEPNQ